MAPFSGSWQSLPGPELLNAHWSQTLGSVSQAALCQAHHHPERRSLSFLLAKAKAPKRASAARGADLCSGNRLPTTLAQPRLGNLGAAQGSVSPPLRVKPAPS